MKKYSAYHIATNTIHAGGEPDKETGAIMPPIFQTSTYVQKSPGKHQGYEYTRSHNPTRTRRAVSMWPSVSDPSTGRGPEIHHTALSRRRLRSFAVDEDDEVSSREATFEKWNQGLSVGGQEGVAVLESHDAVR